MAVQDTAAYRTRGVRLEIGGRIVPQITSVGSIGGGGASEIDITTLASRAREFALSYPDQGSAQIEGIAALHTPAFTELETAANSGDEQSVSIVFGAVPANERVTDGSGILLIEDRPVGSTALVNGKLTITDTAQASLPAVVEGDYLDVDDRGAERITGIARAGGSVVFTTTGVAAVAGNDLTYSLIRPAVRLAFTARVSSLERSVTNEEVVRFSMSLRISGEIDKTIGTPAVAV